MPSTTKQLGAAIVASVIAVAALPNGAFAQAASKPAAKPAQSAPAQAQAPQGQAPQGGASGGPPSGPMRVDLRPAQADWTKVCGKDQAANKEVCYTTRDFGTQADQPPVLAVAVYDVKGDEARIVRFLMPIGLMLRPGFRFSVDKGAAVEGAYEICFPNGCFAETRIKAPTLDAMKKGQFASVSVKNQVNSEVTFIVPLDGFGKAFDGPAIDPKVLEEQQKQLQDQLQKKAEEERKKLDVQKPGVAPVGGVQPTAPAGGGLAPAPATPNGAPPAAK